MSIESITHERDTPGGPYVKNDYGRELDSDMGDAIRIANDRCKHPDIIGPVAAAIFADIRQKRRGAEKIMGMIDEDVRLTFERRESE